MVAAVASDHEAVDLGALRDIFNLSPGMVDNDRNSGFNLLSQALDPYWCLAMNNLLGDSQGEFFIDDNQYADIALCMVKYISATLVCIPPPGQYSLPYSLSFGRSAIAVIFPKILAKSSIRPDLVECFWTPTLVEAYLEDYLIAPAIRTYISVGNFIAAHPLCLTHSQRSQGGAEIIPKFLRYVESQVILIS